MSDKKHIDRIFQERFKDFEATPNHAVWDNIQSKLNQNENNKTTKTRPLWLRYAGIAALLLLLLTIGSLVFDNENKAASNKVVDTENTENTEPEQTNSDKNNTLIITKEAENINDALSNPVVDNKNGRSTQSYNENAVAKTSDNQDNVKNVNASNKVNVSPNNSKGTKSVLVVESNQPKDNHLTPNNSSNKNAIAESSTKEQTIKTTIANTVNPTTIVSSDKNHSKSAKGNNKTSQAQNSVIANNSENQTDLQSSVNENELNESDNTFNSLKEGGIALHDVEFDLENALNIDINSLSIEEAIANLENLIEEEEPLNRWRVSPNVAPVYFNSLGNGSSIDAQFNDNSKSGELNMSYGIAGSYAINDKLIVRSGINKVNLGYSTNDIIVFESTGKGPNSNLLQNISRANSQNQISIVNARALRVDEGPSILKTNAVGSINQNIGYIEVPLELQYRLLNKKFGFNIIGGFSSFFLNENEVFSDIDGTQTFVGEANNINKVSYSANFGLGLNYNMSKNFNLNLEPIFKYQLNTFSNTSGDFNPYFIGVYTGFSFKF